MRKKFIAIINALTVSLAVTGSAAGDDPFAAPSGSLAPQVDADELIPMSVESIIKILNSTKVGELSNPTKEPIASDRIVTHLIFELSRASKGLLVTYWQTLPQGWRASKHEWSLADFGDLTARELLNKVVEREGWSYTIHGGYLLVKQFQVSLKEAEPIKPNKSRLDNPLPRSESEIEP